MDKHEPPRFWKPVTEIVSLKGLGYEGEALVLTNPIPAWVDAIDEVDRLAKVADRTEKPDDKARWREARLEVAPLFARRVLIEGEDIPIPELEEGDDRIISMLLGEALERRVAALTIARATFREERGEALGAFLGAEAVQRLLGALQRESEVEAEGEAAEATEGAAASEAASVTARGGAQRVPDGEQGAGD